MDRVPQPNVLFVSIGWAQQYDRGHPIQGDHEDITSQGGSPSTLGEGGAFLTDSTGIVRCVVGMGSITPSSPIDVVFVARNKGLRRHEIVGIYFQPDFSYGQWTNAKGRVETWADAYTKDFVAFPVGQRPDVVWPPGGRSMRRWARRSGTVRFRDLFQEYVALI